MKSGWRIMRLSEEIAYNQAAAHVILLLLFLVWAFTKLRTHVLSPI
jgi:hypothetical protein